MSLSAPKQIVFIIAVVIAIIALLMFYTSIIPALGVSAFHVLLIGFIVLALGNLLKGM